MARTLAVLILALAGAGAPAQTLKGVVDIHVHCDPDSNPRSIDAVDLAKLAREKGYRALLLKNHFEPTAALAYVLRKQFPGLEFFGGIVLNRPVGGVNPDAVDRFARVPRANAKVVWMPTFDSENQIRQEKSGRPFVSVSRDGKLLPEVLAVLDLIRKYDLVLATGHSTPKEDLLLIEAARQKGITRIVMTHPTKNPIRMSVADLVKATKMGAYAEFDYMALIDPKEGRTIDDYKTAIRAVGVEHAILSSDLGQLGNPLHPDGMERYFGLMRDAGFTVQEIDRMAKQNPARLLGLD